MNQEQKQMPTRYFARRLTNDLIKELVPTSTFNSPEDKATGLKAIWEGASSIGVGLKSLLHGALFSKKQAAINSYPKGSRGPLFPNIYGYFVVVQDKGRIRAFNDPGLIAPPKDSEIFLIADLVGLSIARILGTANQSAFSVEASPGQKSAGEFAIDLWLDPGELKADGAISKEAEERLGRFLQSFMSGRDELTVEDFVTSSDTTLKPLIANMLDLPIPATAWEQGQPLPENLTPLQLALSDFQAGVIRLTGLSAYVRYRPGKKIFRHQVTLDDQTLSTIQQFASSGAEQIVNDDYEWQCPICSNLNEGSAFCQECGSKKPAKEWSCSNCAKHNSMTSSFCQDCGAAKPSAIKETSLGWNAGKLLTSGADELIFDISFVSYDQPNVDLDGIAGKCYETLRTYCRNYALEDLETPARLVDIGKLLSVNLSTGAYGPIGEFSVVDFKTVDSNWKLQTRAQIREQLRNIEGQQAQFVVDEAQFALREAQLLRNKRDLDLETREQQLDLNRAQAQSTAELGAQKVVVNHEVEGYRIEKEADAERYRIDASHVVEKVRTNLDTDTQISELELDALKSGVATDSEKAKLEVEGTKSRAAAEAEKERINRELERQRRQLDREDIQADRLDQHGEIDHEMGLEKKVLEHDISKEQILDKAQREKADKDLEFEDRMARLRSSRNLDEAKQTQDLEIEKIRLEHELQLQKLQMMSSIDIAQKEQLKGLSTAQILAMQATGLAEKGAGEALSELAKNDAETREAQIKAEMLEKMLAMQQTSSQSASDQQMKIMMAALEAQKEATIRVEKAHEKTADSAEKWNEKSIDAMSKVATAAANKGAKGETGKSEKTSAGAKFCPDCGASLSEGTKFCGECGSKIA